MSYENHKKVVETMWAAMSRKDWDTFKSCLHPEVYYKDVPTNDPGATGPENCVKRLVIIFDHIKKHEAVTHHIAIDGDVVFLDHTETFTLTRGETITQSFATMHEMRDGLIYRWLDYWDMANFSAQLPQWLMEEMAKTPIESYAS